MKPFVAAAFASVVELIRRPGHGRASLTSGWNELAMRLCMTRSADEILAVGTKLALYFCLIIHNNPMNFYASRLAKTVILNKHFSFKEDTSMKVSNGYVWSKKYARWRRLPRHAWLKIQRERLLRIARKNNSKDKPA
jgi:hypothetical protein